jgi:hypothetical protein
MTRMSNRQKKGEKQQIAGEGKGAAADRRRRSSR